MTCALLKGIFFTPSTVFIITLDVSDDSDKSYFLLLYTLRNKIQFIQMGKLCIRAHVALLFLLLG
jgi:hypothetical protein